MQPRNTYRHARCLDVDIYVCEVVGISSTGTAAIVRYINRRTQDFLGQELVFIKREEYLHWSKINS